MLEKLLILLRIFEAIACIVGFIYFNKLKPAYWRLFPFYLAFIVCAEFIGSYLESHDLNANKIFFNYFEIPIEFLFFFWLFYKSFTNDKYNWLPMVCGGLYLVSWFVDNLIFSNQPKHFSSISYTTGNLLLLVLILRFFFRLVTSDSILTFRQNRLFWVSLGLLIFYFGSFPYYGLSNTIGALNKDITIAYNHIVLLLNCLMYIMFTFSFILGKSNIKSS